MEAFLPPMGVLCVAMTVSNSTLEILYCFRNAEDDPRRYWAICKMSGFSVSPCEDAGYTFGILDIFRVAGTPQVPVTRYRHLCTDQELRAIKVLWQVAPPGVCDEDFLDFERWLADILAKENIPDGVKEQLRKLI